jgi:hypothetical protein
VISVRPLSLFLSAAFLCAATAYAQDPFEIHVYEYEPLPRGSYTYEAHLNYIVKGTNQFDGTLAPTEHQSHYSSEFTAGLTDQFRMAAVVMTALRPDHSLEYAGWRILPHLYAPPSWHLPLNLGLVAEFSFNKTTYEENTRGLEIRPIIEKHIGRLQLDGNPVFGRALRGPGTSEGWVFEPAGRVAWQTSRWFTPSLEYYSSLGPVRNVLPLHDQIHQIFPGGDLRIGDHLLWSFGVGFGATGTGSRLIVKSRFEFAFGGKHGTD